MPDQLTPLQTLALWWLLVNGGTGLQQDIKSKFEKKDREALVAAGLITAEKNKKRAYVLSVTDKGWHWAGQTMVGCTLSRSQAAAEVLQVLLAHLGAYMQAREISLAEILTTAPQSSTASEPPDVVTTPDPVVLRDRIRTAFLKLTGGHFNTRVRLADLRPLLSEFDRATQDEALARIGLEDGATLMQIDDRTDIARADHDAALQFGTEPRHLLWISK